MPAYAYVRLLNGFERELVYRVPEQLKEQISPGVFVHVPLQKRTEHALVVTCSQQKPVGNFALRDLLGVEPLMLDQDYHQFIKKLAAYYFLDPFYFYQRIYGFLHEKEGEPQEAPVAPEQKPKDVVLTHEQQAVVDYVAPFLQRAEYCPTLIHGVTGSGKSEVYANLIRKAIHLGKSVIFLLPEVSLSVQFEHLFAKKMPDIPVVGFHSASSTKQKRQLWQLMREGKPVLVFGVHLPILLPMQNVGLIVVDEEHEQGFEEKKHPRINSKHIALWRAQTYQIPIILGSATPSLASLHSVAHRGWKLFEITKRFSGNFPKIRKVELAADKSRRPSFWISKELEREVKACLVRKQQIMIYLNRRGYSFFVQCKTCGFTFECKDCSVSLTLHRQKTSDGQFNSMLHCHYCDYKQVLPTACAGCNASEKSLLKKGIGTQQLLDIFVQLFPHARVARADLDTTKKKRSWQETVERFSKGELDILIGTQTITKGYHFPGVTLVGVLWADLNLHFPLYDASERTLQQLIQVAGRAGRVSENSVVVVQVMRDHPIFDYLDEQAYMQFCQQELEIRQEVGYPPFMRLMYIELRHQDAAQVQADGQVVADSLMPLCAQSQDQITVLGPALPLVHRIARYEMRHIVIKAKTFTQLRAVANLVEQLELHSDVFFVHAA
ncbi:MAG: primosomal protein N' [Epsilonproteobacteria bacterium]|nr:primosomal protein N' [Campylobacterota bacterium]